METCSVLPLSNLSFFPPKLNRNKAFPSSPSDFNQRISHSTRLLCQKMYVPGGYYNFLSVCAVADVCISVLLTVRSLHATQVLQEHRQKLRRPKTSTIFSIILQLRLSLPSFRFPPYLFLPSFFHTCYVELYISSIKLYDLFNWVSK